MKFDDKKVDHLFILVGSNALPCALAGLLLAKENGNISLITSEGSYDVAQRLQTWLEEKFDQKTKIQLKSIKESSPQSIFNGVAEELDRVKADFIGLNYTGGTKIMSVHSYRAIEQWVAEQSKTKTIKTSFSYLNPRKLEMVFDPKNPSSSESEKTKAIGQKINLKFTDLLNLHGWTLRKELNTEAIYPKSANYLINLIKDNIWNEWEIWITDEFRKQTRREKDPNKRKSKTQLKEITLTLPENLTGFIECLKLELNLNLDQSIFNNIKDPESLCEWLEGLWLEYYLLEQLQKIFQEASLCDFGQDIKVREIDFQLDAIAVCGYQLFAFSCTTDSKKGMLKLKLFEAFMRARQLGGDEARVALVCCSTDPQEVEKEAHRDVDTEGRIKVFGLQDLPDLANKLKIWIKDQSHQNK